MSNRRIGIGKGHEITTINDTYPIFDEGKLIGAVEIARDVTALEKFVLHPFRKNSDPVTFNQIIAVLRSNEGSHFNSQKSGECKIARPLNRRNRTGKDLIAESIHNELSPSNGLFYTLYCHSSDPALIERLSEDLNMSGTVHVIL